jgi:hypothetical protein
MTTIINGSSPSITFSDSTTQASAGLPLTGGNLSGSIAFTASNAGITFANSSALTNSQLNDYETGTFTPTFSGTGITYTTQYGSYTKIGNLVYIEAYIKLSGGTPTSAITNLPFTSHNTPVNSYSMGINVYIGTGSFVFYSGATQICSYIGPNSTFVLLETQGSGVPANAPTIGNTVGIYITGCYQANF